ncbi:MAG TPA: M48 family metallopeptidase [Alphaproteobacteria bacterium]|nr:M48 family metallopeptidase [Alphaproteobacteria bacterium]
MRKILLGLLAGASAGYVAVRAAQAIALGFSRVEAVSSDAAAYGRARRTLTVAGTLRSTLSTLAFAYGPLAPSAARALEPLPRWLRPGAFFGALALVSSIVELPVTFVEDYALERQYGLSDQSSRAFLADWGKGTAISAVVAAGLALLGGVAVRRFRTSWPIVASLGMLPLFVLANLIVPIYILPLFNRFEPLRGPLEERLRALASRFDVGNAEILRMDMSRQTKKANAFVAGIGSTHRIVLGDTLIDAFEPDEIEFVVAHELGHYVTRDTWRMIALAETVTATLLAVVALGLRDDESHDSVFLLRIAAWLGAGTLAVRPAINAFSRSREWAADRFALATTGDARSGAAAFRRLRDQNLAEEEPPAWYEFLFASHPSLGKRIGALESA